MIIESGVCLKLLFSFYLFTVIALEWLFLLFCFLSLHFLSRWRLMGLVQVITRFLCTQFLSFIVTYLFTFLLTQTLENILDK